MEVFRQSGQHFDLRIFVSTKNQMTLRFSSDRSVRGRGFQIKFHGNVVTDDCTEQRIDYYFNKTHKD